jgi:hypothetical protein
MRALRIVAAIVLSVPFLSSAPVPSQQSAAGEALTNEALIKLVKAGLGDDVIVGMIKSQPGRYSVSPDAVIAMKDAGVSDKVIAAVVSVSGTAGHVSQQSQVSTRQSAAPSILTAGGARKLRVRAVSHSRSERDFTVTTPQTTDTNCDLYPNSVSCRSTSYGGASQQRAVYRFVEIVTSSEGGQTTQYTLWRTARWIWNSTDWLSDGESFSAEIKGKQMSITCRRGGNQGKKEVLKFDIVDIRPVP